MQAQSTNQGYPNVIYVDLGATPAEPKTRTRIEVSKRSAFSEIVLNLILISFVVVSVLACAQQSIRLSMNRSLESFVEQTAAPCELIASQPKGISPERS